MTTTTLTAGAAAVLLAGLAFAEPAPPLPPEPVPAVKYKPGSGFTLASGDDFTLQVGGRIQARYTYEALDDDRSKEDFSRFTAERVRLAAKGTMFKDWKFSFQADFGKGQVSLRDAEVTWAKYVPAQVTAGQFKVRFDRSEYVSSGRQMFVDRSLTTRTFGLSRDVGVMVAGEPFDKKLQYNFGIFDGEKAPTPAAPNANDGHLYVARFSFNPNGDFGLSESDIKKTDYHLWFVDVAGAWNNDQWKDGNTDGLEQASELTDTTSYVFGFGYRHAGIYLAGERYWRSTEKEDGTSDVDADGWYGQLGYTFIRDKWEVAARYGEIDPNSDADDDTHSETTVGLNRYFKGAGHSLKLQGDVSWIEEAKAAPADDLKDRRYRLQAQIVF